MSIFHTCTFVICIYMTYAFRYSQVDNKVNCKYGPTLKKLVLILCALFLISIRNKLVMIEELPSRKE